MKIKIITSIFALGLTFLQAQNTFTVDTINTSAGELKITFIGHGTLMFEIEDKVIHVDPVSRYADYSNMPKADLILITHHHGDHMEKATINKLIKDGTELIVTEAVKDSLNKGKIMKNGDEGGYAGVNIKAVPAYNLIHKRDNGEFYHPKGVGSGYIITFGDKKVYVAGDTEYVPEMNDLKNIDIAFLPMNLPYTMTVEMAADAAKVINPDVLYPYHFGSSHVKELDGLLAGTDIEVRYRDME